MFENLLTQCESIEVIAKGGQKQVYGAIHPEYGSIVIKHGDFSIAGGLDRIAREVRALNEIDSPYYPKQHEFIVDVNSGAFIIVEERLKAVELRSVMAQHSSGASALRIAQELVTALSELWRRRIIHRDVKPENVLITPDGEVRVIDLGIARFLDQQTLTVGGAPMGPATPIYAAPEQLRNQISAIGLRTDAFLIALLSLELLCQSHPFHPDNVGGSEGIVGNILSGNRLPVPAGCPLELARFIDAALQQRAFKRPRTIEGTKSLLGME